MRSRHFALRQRGTQLAGVGLDNASSCSLKAEPSIEQGAIQSRWNGSSLNLQQVDDVVQSSPSPGRFEFFD